MALYHTLLGLLAKKPMTGYQMKQTFSSSILFFWNAHISQIYKELNKMEQKGWVESEIEPQSGKPDRKVYSLTSAGKDEFLQWLQDIKKASEESIKSEFMAKLFLQLKWSRNRSFLNLSASYSKKRKNWLSMKKSKRSILPMLRKQKTECMNI